MIATRQNSHGVFGSLRNLLDTGLSAVQNRIELIGVELHEERARLLKLLVAIAAALILGAGGGVVLTVALVLAFPPAWRPGVMAACGLIYIAAAAIILARVRQQLKECPPPLFESLVQIKKDREWLNSPQ